MQNDMLYDIDERAAKLFGVFQVTPTMRSMVTVRRKALSLADFGGQWRLCPQCGQSATGKYNQYHSCSRCNWNEGRVQAASFKPKVPR